ncbi:hypothetical protein [Microbulbifer epialgicus]|uniref:Uncharacterized protein n=1 Tax=Microbulbifer epialgicus TaxID=393907 RepID=A0ABV4P428_9GAMM
MSDSLNPSGKCNLIGKLPQWVNCQDRLPSDNDATSRGLVRVVWQEINTSDGVTLTTWEVGIDHYENAHRYIGWMPIITE